jgi:hypothetical protein
MNVKRRNGSRAIAALLLFSIVQFGLAATPIPQQLAGRLKTSNNQPITINSLSANTGASILSGATLETGADQSATVDLGPLGSVDIAPNTKVILTFEQGNAKATVITGCVTLKAAKGTAGEVANEQSSISKSDPVVGGILNNCSPQGPTTPQNQGTPGNAGNGGLFGLGRAATIAILVAAGAAATTPLFFQDNPSRSRP